MIDIGTGDVEHRKHVKSLSNRQREKIATSRLIGQDETSGTRGTHKAGVGVGSLISALSFDPDTNIHQQRRAQPLINMQDTAHMAFVVHLNLHPPAPYSLHGGPL